MGRGGLLGIVEPYCCGSGLFGDHNLLLQVNGVLHEEPWGINQVFFLECGNVGRLGATGGAGTGQHYGRYDAETQAKAHQPYLYSPRGSDLGRRPSNDECLDRGGGRCGGFLRCRRFCFRRLGGCCGDLAGADRSGDARRYQLLGSLSGLGNRSLHRLSRWGNQSLGPFGGCGGGRGLGFAGTLGLLGRGLRWFRGRFGRVRRRGRFGGDYGGGRSRWGGPGGGARLQAGAASEEERERGNQNRVRNRRVRWAGDPQKHSRQGLVPTSRSGGGGRPPPRVNENTASRRRDVARAIERFRERSGTDVQHDDRSIVQADTRRGAPVSRFTAETATALPGPVAVWQTDSRRSCPLASHYRKAGCFDGVWAGSRIGWGKWFSAIRAGDTCAGVPA
jgi:hypothetical protein